MPKTSFETSPFLRAVREAVDGIQAPFDGVLHVSIAAEPKWETLDGDRVLVRWVCWNLERDGQEVTKPEFDVFGEQITRQQLERELPEFFPGIRVLVDDDIEV